MDGVKLGQHGSTPGSAAATGNSAGGFAEDSAGFFERLHIADDIAAFIALNPGYTVSFDASVPLVDAYFRGRVWHDWLTIKDHLPARDALSILDIGSGVGGVNVAIGAHHHGAIDLTAVDKAQRQGFNVHQLAANFAKANLDAATVRGLPPGDDAIGDRHYDLITSFRGLCYMFPFSAYASIIERSLKRGGSIIVDVSTREDDGSEVIRGRFGCDSGSLYEQVLAEIDAAVGTPEVIFTGTDYQRIVAVRRA